MIVARLVAERAGLAARRGEPEASTREALAARGVVARSAVFTTDSPGADAARLATEQDVDLVLVAAPAALLEDADLGDLLRAAPCDVAVLTGGEPTVGPVLVPFAGTDHDWSAIELGAWLAGSWQVPLRLAGPAVRAAETRAVCSRAPPSPFSARWAWPPSRCSSSPARTRSSPRPARRRHGRRPVGPLAQGGPRPDQRRAGRERPPDAAGPQGPPAGRPRTGGEPDPVHLVAQGG